MRHDRAIEPDQQALEARTVAAITVEFPRRQQFRLQRLPPGRGSHVQERVPVKEANVPKTLALAGIRLVPKHREALL